MDWLANNGSVVHMVAIVVICAFIGFAIKTGSGGNEKVTRWIPLIVGVVGGILGVVYKFISAEYANLDILMAIASGIVSGLASTGAHQVVKQVICKPNAAKPNGKDDSSQ
ncbi:MAG: phage holin family protein [Bacillota bacterium]|nr:phage holin family protein [Bacillota bacterium]